MQILHISRRNPTKPFNDRNERILEFLREYPVGVLATVDPNGNPHTSVIYHNVDEKFNVSFLTKRGTKKSDNFKHFNRVSLVVFEPTSQTTVQIQGMVKEVRDEEELHRIFRATLRASLRTSKAGIPPISKLGAGDYVAYQIKPVEVRMAVFARPDAGNYDKLFEYADLN